MSVFYEYCLTKTAMFVLELQIPFCPLVLNGGAKRQNLQIYAWNFPLDHIPTSTLIMGSQVSLSPYRKPFVVSSNAQRKWTATLVSISCYWLLISHYMWLCSVWGLLLLVIWTWSTIAFASFKHLLNFIWTGETWGSLKVIFSVSQRFIFMCMGIGMHICLWITSISSAHGNQSRDWISWN